MNVSELRASLASCHLRLFNPCLFSEIEKYLNITGAFLIYAHVFPFFQKKTWFILPINLWKGGEAFVRATMKRRIKVKELHPGEKPQPLMTTTIVDRLKVAKKRKLVDRFNGVSKEELMGKVLPDRLKENLDIIFVGTIPCPVPWDGIRHGTDFFKAFLKKLVLQIFFLKALVPK